MKRLFSFLLSLTLLPLLFASPVLAGPSEDVSSSIMNQLKYFVGPTREDKPECTVSPKVDTTNIKYGLGGSMIGMLSSMVIAPTDPCGNPLLTDSGLLPIGNKIITAMLYEQPSGREYMADLLDSIGLPSVTSAYAQGTGYQAMSPFLPIWKVFRNVAYSLYIIMFVVVGVMIMLRTKVNAQTVITIQAALPNLLITLILITFSYAIVGFMVDIMYFLIYFLVYLVDSTNLINSPTAVIDRLLSYSAYGVLFEGRNSIVSAASLAMGEILSGLGTGALEVAGTIISWISPAYLIVAIWLAVAMLKLMFFLVKSYVMLIIQTITAPVQILFNAMPGSKSFSEWLKKTASYLLPFPVAAGMFILAAIFVGDPTNATVFEWAGNANPFSINQNHEFYQNGDSKLWLPPFTLTGSVDFTQDDVMVLIGFFIFTMTPAVIKMAQDWLQVKESPYTAEAFAGAGTAIGIAQYPYSLISSTKRKQEEIWLAKEQARWNAQEYKKVQG